MDYKKCWNTLKAESGGRWCQPHPLSNELLTIGELMRNMERRAPEQEESPSDSPASPVQHAQAEIIRYLSVVEDQIREGNSAQALIWCAEVRELLSAMR